MITVKNLTVDPEGRAVWLDGQEVRLTRLEFDVLALLASDPTRVFTFKEIYMNVWGYDPGIDTRTAQVAVTRMRKKLGGPEGGFVRSVNSVGYQLQRPVFREEAA
jgi:DNA-binding response OmpR family regulator